MATARAADEPITQIKLQHSQCGYGCSTDELTLNADGSAEFAGERHDIARQNLMRRGFYRGQLASEKFEDLSEFLNASDFFDLRVEVGENRSLHFSDTIVSVQRNHLYATVVFHRGYGGKLLPQLEALCADASAQIAWQKDEAASQSGVSGNVTRDATPAEAKFFTANPNSMPMRYALVSISSRDDPTISYSTLTDDNGRFRFFAPPGRYSVGAYDYNLSRPYEIGAPKWDGDSLKVEIKADEFADATIQMHDASSNRNSQ